MIVGWMQFVLEDSKDDSIADDPLLKRRLQNERNSLMGKKMVSQLLLKYYRIDLSLEKNPIRKTSMGKPYLINHPDIHFNISHSEQVVACVVAEEPVGLDVQFCNVKNIQKLAKKVLSIEEMEQWEKSECAEKVFLEFWTKKESYLKFTGDGIRSDLRTTTYDGAVFKTIDLCPGYIGMLCMPQKSTEKIQVVEILDENFKNSIR